MNDPLHRRPTAAAPLAADAGAPVRHDRRPLLVAAVVASLVCGVIAVSQSGDGDSASASNTSATTVPVDAASASTDLVAVASVDPGAIDPAASAAPTTLAPGVTLPGTTVPGAVADAGAVGDLDGGEDTTSDACVMDKMSTAVGDTGASVTCLQAALVRMGFLGAATGTFDNATYAAVRSLQTEQDLYVDGIVGRETALALGIWPDENALVIRTPPPAPGAMDSYGYLLSYVATAGKDAPPLPANSGSGKRLVYDRAGQRVWAVDKNEQVIRSWLVSGSKYGNELPGTHEVYSKSEMSTAWNGKAYLPKMVRWLKTERGAIGFHGIPRHVEDNSRYQSDEELGTRLSGGCQRQADLDAAFVWDFADIGTKVVVI